MDSLEGLVDGSGGSVRKGFSMDAVAVVVIQDKDVVVALAGLHWESASLVTEGSA